MEHPELLMRGAAHDIRGYLASASLATENLCIHEDATVARSAARISLAIEQIISICQNDLSVSDNATATTNYSTNSITSLLEQISSLVRPRLEDSFNPLVISLSVADDVSIECNSSNLFRILYNLSVNAVHAIMTHSGNQLELKVFREKNNICFIVADDGPGLPKHIIDQFYSRVSSLASEDRRTGYGLTSSANLAKAMHGTLQLIESSPSGSTFRLTLPDSLVRQARP